MDSGLDNVYVVHAPMGYEKQGEYSSKLLAKHKIAFQFINESSLPNLTDCINIFFCATTQRQLTKGALLCTLSHILCYQKIVKNNDKFALILEDDPYLLNGFDNLLPKIISQLADLESGFIVSLENSTLTFPSFKDIKKQQYIYPALEGRCAGAYLIDQKGAQNILNWLEHTKCDDVIDLWHNNLVTHKVIRIFWAHPPIVEQCSLNGMMNATISSRKKSYTRRLAWLAQKYYKMHFLRFTK